MRPLSDKNYVFFGTHGAFSITLLEALIRAELPPGLVIVGVEKPKDRRGPLVRFRSADPGFWEQLVWGTRRNPNPPPEGTIDLEAVAHSHRLDVIVTSDPGALRVRADLHQRVPEGYVVAGFPRLLSPEVLGLATRGGINVHPGRLPGERGPSPLFWALKDGRTDLGFAIHLLDAGEDTGDVLVQGSYKIIPGASAHTVLKRCGEAAAPHLIRVLRSFFAGEVLRTPQPSEGAARRPRPEFKDGQIDPEKKAIEIYTFVSACARHYSLFVENAGDRFFVAGAASYQEGATLPSEYVVTGDTLLLRCADGIVELSLKPEGAVFSAEY
ncbi:MAG: formyltransferase family protein [Myxococcota bacterium]